MNLLELKCLEKQNDDYFMQLYSEELEILITIRKVLDDSLKTIYRDEKDETPSCYYVGVDKRSVEKAITYVDGKHNITNDNWLKRRTRLNNEMLKFYQTTPIFEVVKDSERHK
jgi:hypothetical protein